MKKTFYMMTIALTALLLSGCGNGESNRQKLPSVRLTTVQMSTGVKQNHYPGKTRAADDSQVAFKVAGTIESVPVKAGDFVRKGQVVARMDSRDYQVQLTAVKAEYESTKAECERIIALYNDRGTSANNYDKARYGLEQITQKLRHAQDQVNDCVIRAPFDGYVQSVLHEAHETVGAGMPVISMFSDKGVEVVINIPVAEFNRKDEFANITATFSNPDCILPLRLVNISHSANANQLYEMRLSIDDKTKGITPGLTTMVHINYKDTDTLDIEIPSAAVFENAGKSYVFVYSDSAVHKTEVRVRSLTSSGKMRVISGISAGQKVVTSGVHSLSDGQRVRPATVPSKTNVGGLL